MRSPRFTTRWLMALVALVAFSMWARSRFEARRSHFRELVQQYQVKSLTCSVFSYSGPGGAHKAEQMKAHAARMAKPLAYYTEMVEKYEHAVRYPWLPVLPDPPPPQ